MEINIERINAIAEPLPELTRERMASRKSNRHWKAASSAIAAKIKRQLKKKGITQAAFAEMLGITPANVTRYLNGSTNFELRTLIEIERALGLTIIDRQVVPDEDLIPEISNTYNFTISDKDCFECSKMEFTIFTDSLVAKETSDHEFAKKFLEYA